MILRLLIIVFSISFYLFDYGVDVVLVRQLQRAAFPDGHFPRRQSGGDGDLSGAEASIGGQIVYALSFGNDSATFGDGAAYFRGAHFLISAFWLLAGGVAQLVLVVLEMSRQEVQRQQQLNPPPPKQPTPSSSTESLHERTPTPPPPPPPSKPVPERLLISVEWRVAIIIGALFGMAPNLCYCYILGLSFLSKPTSSGALTPKVDAAIVRCFRLASVAKLGQVFFESLPQIITQTLFASLHGFNEGVENMAGLQRVSVLGSLVAISCAVANYLYERRLCLPVNVFIHPLYHSVSSAISIAIFCASELCVMAAFCRMANFCGVCLSTQIAPLVVITAGGFCLLFLFCKPEHDWARRFCVFISIKGSAWFLAVGQESSLGFHFFLGSGLGGKRRGQSLVEYRGYLYVLSVHLSVCMYILSGKKVYRHFDR